MFFTLVLGCQIISQDGKFCAINEAAHTAFFHAMYDSKHNTIAWQKLYFPLKLVFMATSVTTWISDYLSKYLVYTCMEPLLQPKSQLHT